MRLFLLFISLSLLVSSRVFGVPLDGERVFTVQVASFGNERKAEEVTKYLLGKGFRNVWIKHVNDRFRVRVGFFDTREEAVEFTKELREKGLKGYYVTLVEFNRKNVKLFQTQEKVEKPVEEVKQAENKLERNREETSNMGSSELGSVVREVKPKEPEEKQSKVTESGMNNAVSNALNENKFTSVKAVSAFEKNERLEKERSDLNNISFSISFWRYLPFALLLLISLFFYLSFSRRNRIDETVGFEEYLLALLEDGKCEKLIETALPFLEKDGMNTFVRELVAQCYVKQGKWLEAASMYKEISEILKRKGLLELSERMEKKFEELSAKEFIKGGENPLL